MNVTEFTSRSAEIDNDITKEVKNILQQMPIELPNPGAPIVHDYVQRIEGQYRVENGKKDTDNAVDLLYIAYNTTPQEEGEIRVTISGIMDDLIEVQRVSELTMLEANRVANRVLSLLKNTFPDWLDVSKGDEQKVKAFVNKDLGKLTNDIQAQAMAVHAQLLNVAKTYDEILKKTRKASDASEKALSTRVANKKKIEEEIWKANADRERLDQLVKDLAEEVRNFENKANEYERRANKVEERAFIMQIVQIGAQVVASAIPPIALASATGGTGLLASAALGAARVNAPTSSDKPQGSSQQEAQTKSDISKKQGELDRAEAKVKDSETNVEAIRKDLAKELCVKCEDANTPLTAEEEQKPGDTQAMTAIKGRLKDAKAELANNQEKKQELELALAALQASLSSLTQGLGELKQEMKDQAAGLRDMQIKLLDKADAYEKERRTQAGELATLKALLVGKLTEEETVQLAIKSLNVSVGALKKTKEIVVEIAAFFKSFADFMRRVGDEAQTQLDLLGKDGWGANALKNLVQSTDTFFITQTAEWHATSVVADKFAKNFADGWSKLNKLTGEYITGDKLKEYLKGAAALLEHIALVREKEVNARIEELERKRRALHQTPGVSKTAA